MVVGVSTVIFVHGTGIRAPVFSKLFGRIRSELHQRRPELGIEPCYWGGTEGARLWHDGGSVPAYDATRGIVPGPEDEELALWDLLYRDRLWELRMLAMTGPTGGELPPGRLPPGDVLNASVRGLDPSPELAADVFSFLRTRVAPFQRVRRLEFADLPKTSSGKIRRVQLRALEAERRATGSQGEWEYCEEDVVAR